MRKHLISIVKFRNSQTSLEVFSSLILGFGQSFARERRLLEKSSDGRLLEKSSDGRLLSKSQIQSITKVTQQTSCNIEKTSFEVFSRQTSLEVFYKKSKFRLTSVKFKSNLFIREDLSEKTSLQRKTSLEISKKFQFPKYANIYKGRLLKMYSVEQTS